MCSSLVSYGSEDNVILRNIKPQRPDDTLGDVAMDGATLNQDSPGEVFELAVAFANQTHEIVLRRFGDPNVLPYFHVTMVFIYHVSFFPAAIALLEKNFPWKLVSLMLNTLISTYKTLGRIESDSFPRPDR